MLFPGRKTGPLAGSRGYIGLHEGHGTIYENVGVSVKVAMCVCVDSLGYESVASLRVNKQFAQGMWFSKSRIGLLEIPVICRSWCCERVF